MINTACPSDGCCSIPFCVAVSVFSSFTSSLFSSSYSRSDSRCISSLYPHTPWMAATGWLKCSSGGHESKSAAGQTHTVRRSKVTQHYAPLDTSPQQNPAKLFCPKWQRWRYSMYLGEDYKSVSNTTSLTKGRSSAAESSGKPETTLPTFTFCRYFYVSNKKVVIPKECCNTLESWDCVAFERNWCYDSINESCSNRLKVICFRLRLIPGATVVSIVPQEEMKFRPEAFLSNASALSSWLCGFPGALLTTKMI